MDPNEGQLSPEDQAVVDEFDRQLEGTSKQEPQLILGKFKTNDDLAKAYVELQKKLGGGNPQTTPEPTEPVTADPNQKLEIGIKPEEPVVETPERPLSEYLQDMGEGNFDDAMRDEIKRNFNLDDSTIDMMAKTAQAQYQNSVNEIIKEAGGQEQLNQLSEWVASTYTETQIADINSALKNDMLRGAVIRDLKSKMAASYNAPTQRESAVQNLGVPSTQGFATDKEMNAAMQDERYLNPQHPEHANFVEQVQLRFMNSPHLH